MAKRKNRWEGYMDSWYVLVVVFVLVFVTRLLYDILRGRV